jgi:hypothetical protein
MVAASVVIGCDFGHRRTGSVTPAAVVYGDPANAAAARVATLIDVLQNHPRWRTRDNAAVALRGFDWRRHPVILDALASSLLNDPEDEVREEAAESLARIKPAPCLSTVHAALQHAAACDPDHATRKWARRALARLDLVCRDACDLCRSSVILDSRIETQRLNPTGVPLPLPSPIPTDPPSAGRDVRAWETSPPPDPPNPSLPTPPDLDQLPPPPAEALPFDLDQAPPLTLPGTARSAPFDHLSAPHLTLRTAHVARPSRPAPRSSVR